MTLMSGLAFSKTLITSLNAASSDPVNAPRMKTLPVSGPAAGAIVAAGGVVGAGAVVGCFAGGMVGAGAGVGCSAGAAVGCTAAPAVAPVTPPPAARTAVGAGVAAGCVEGPGGNTKNSARIPTAAPAPG